MLRTVTLAASGVVLALAAAVWLAPWDDTGPTQAWNGTAALEERVVLLESAVRAEMNERLLLEFEVMALREELAELRDVPQSATPTETAFMPPRGGEAAGVEQLTLRERAAERFARLGAFGPGEGSARRLERLVAEGFSPDRAASIERRTEELRMEALQAQYDAARDGRPLEARDAWSGERQLRQELGDADYERYLRALARPTSVGVRQVLASSPAERAGLAPGDQIVAYGGQRVFNMADLNELTFQGAPGQPVAIDVLRDGQQIQLYMPRGPVGIVGGGRQLPRRP